MTDLSRKYPTGVFSSAGQLNEDASTADLLHLMFWSGRVHDDDFLGKMIHSTLDDMAIMIDALDTPEPSTDAIQFGLIRARDRLLAGLLLNERIAAEAELDEEAMARKGWIRRDSALKAVHILCGDDKTVVDNMPPSEAAE